VRPSDLALRGYTAADEEAAIELWRRTWQTAYPHIDFTARLSWWRERWRSELVPSCIIMVAEESNAAAGELIGFVTIEAKSGYLDQLVVAPERWGSHAAGALLDAAKDIAPAGIDLHVNCDNERAIRFYKKHGFAVTGKDVNPRSGSPIYKMSWRA
jgi:putative acetyltransferase